MQKNSYFCDFIVTFQLITNQKCFKLVALHTSQCVSPMPINSMSHSGTTNISYQLKVKKVVTMQKNSFFCSFFVIFQMLLNQKCFKLVTMHVSQCVSSMPTNSMAHRGITNIFYGLREKKMQNMVFFCVKMAKNPKFSSEFFCFLFFLVAHMLLE